MRVIGRLLVGIARFIDHKDPTNGGVARYSSMVGRVMGMVGKMFVPALARVGAICYVALAILRIARVRLYEHLRDYQIIPSLLSVCAVEYVLTG